jgi:hypothetical protein
MELLINQDSNEIAKLVWRFIFYPSNSKTTQVLVNAISGAVESIKSICLNENPATGKVWDPDPSSIISTLFTDSYSGVYDADRSQFQIAYKTINLLGLNSPSNQNGVDYYFLQGDYANSQDLKSPSDAVTKISIQPGNTEPEFYFTRNQNGFEETNIYYHIDAFLRYIIGTLQFNSLSWNNNTAKLDDIVFDARWYDPSDPDQSYFDGSGTVFYGVPPFSKDHGEDQSVIIHEVGHALHCSLLASGSPIDYDDCIAISEGLGDYFGIDYRRQISLWHPNHRFAWLYQQESDSRISVFDKGYLYDFNHWYDPIGMGDPHNTGKIWTSALMDLEYNVCTDPTQGYRLGREVVVRNQLSALSSLPSVANKEQNVLAMYNADLINYNGLHLREYIDVYSMDNRKLFNDQKISNNITSSNWSGYKMINNDVHVQSGSILMIANNTIIVMNGKLYIDANATLSIGENVRFIGYNPEHIVIVNGNIGTIGENLLFELVGNANYFGGLSISGSPSGYTSVTLNSCTFNNSRLFFNCNSLTAVNCDFTNCNQIISYRGNVAFTNCTFQNSPLYINNLNNVPEYLVTVNGCTFNQTISTSNTDGIYISKYGKFEIESNSISGFANGIRLFNSGYSIIGNRLIDKNVVFNCTNTGILTYYTFAEITNNSIYNNNYGIQLLNNSNVKVKGTYWINPPPIPSLTDTQNIFDNNSNEVYCSFSSFPTEMHYNRISDINNTDPSNHIPLIYYNPSYNTSIPFPLNVESNCWGNNFIPGDLYCTRSGVTFDSQPTWCLGMSDNLTTSGDEELYQFAQSEIVSGDFITGEETLKSIVELFPKSSVAPAALKELFRIEKNLGNDYQSLGEYYLNNDTISNDSTLLMVARFLANKCAIESGLWQNAIDWYENEISNPISSEDSIFAIIDLGYLYEWIESSGLKNAYLCKMPQYKPSSPSSFATNRDYLLSLLPIVDKIKIIDSTSKKAGALLYNVPNPFEQKTEIYYSLNRICRAKIVIIDINGREVYSFDDNIQSAGVHKILFNRLDIKSGIYVYSLLINGTFIHSKRMIIL